MFKILLTFLLLNDINLPEKFLIKTPPNTVLLNEVITLRPTDGLHFNLKAPQSCGPFKFDVKKPSELSCQLSKTGSIKLRTSICDEKESFCKTETFPVSVVSKWNSKASNISKLPIKNRKLSTAPDKNGFYENPEFAFNLAKKEKKLLLIDFGAEWCPSCNALEEFVIPTKEFASSTSNFVKLKIDYDKPETEKWKNKLDIKFIPSLIVAKFNLNEFDRRIGYSYEDPAVVIAWIKKTSEIPETLSQIEKLIAYPKNIPAEKLSAYRLRLAKANWDHPNAVLKILANENSKAANREKLLATYRISKRSDDEAKIAARLEDLIQQFPEDLEYSQWVSALIDLNKSKGLPYADSAIKNLKSLTNSPLLAENGYSKTDILDSLGQIYSAKGDKEAAKKAYAEAADLSNERAKKSSLKVSRGPNLDRAYFLTQAGKENEARDLYAQMADQYKEEYTFNYRYAKVLLKTKNLENALVYAQRAFENSYGQNSFYAETLVAEIELNQGKKEIAKSRLESALAKLKLPSEKDNWQHRVLDRIREVLAKI